ncbi:winged helix-turn-helix transcriptional regulator [Amycolatopsis acidicola]|uniref:Winged helix-turn-helix transcriptional regulator n=1 Tax=Amycolatopsis acidicola TaxID=2596893 RepID=A0A5N0VHR1_9PSEU|nr:winged helix-turn-helix domain-containing protein [Amycolatopsis acidicola]KAA9164974.1 winged helix-turn-helix transcriptional regulator [Amycolatopsis acidicola]
MVGAVGKFGPDPDDPRAPYLQVASGLRAAIKAGEYTPGAQLPSYQELAESWSVAINTAKSAVGLLRDEGLVVVRPGKGSFVRSQAVEDQAVGHSGEGGDERVWQAIADLRRRVADLERGADHS